MSTQYKRLRGQDTEVVASTAATGATALTNWTDVSASIQIEKDPAKAASSPHSQWTPGEFSAELEFSGFVGEAENPRELPQPGDELKSLAIQTVTEGEDMLFALDEARCGKIVVTEVNYKQTDKPGTWSFKASSGAILPPVIEAP